MERKLLVLGAGSSLGSMIIEKEADNYSKIIAQYKSSSEKISCLKKKLGNRLGAIQADFTIDEQIDYLLKRLKEEELITDVVHLTANKIQYKKFPKTSWDDVEKDMAIQVKSAWRILACVLPQMEKAGFGRIAVILSSCTANTPPRYLSGYVTCKYALLGMVKSLAAEYASKNILINAASPGMMDTKFLEYVPKYVVEDTMRQNPMKRLADASDIYPAVKLFLSQENQYITGQNLIIAGGE